MIPTILDRHTEDASFLWHRRDDYAHGFHVDRHDLQQVDWQLAGHIEGLQIAHEAGWSRVWQALDNVREGGEAFIATLFASQTRKKTIQLMELVAAEPATHRGCLSALAWLATDAAPKDRGLLNLFLQSSEPLLQSLSVGAYGLLGIDPGEVLTTSLEHTNIHLQSRALRVVGELGLDNHRVLLSANLNHDARPCRFWAAWSLVLLGDRDEALDYLARVMLTPEHPYQIKAMLPVLKALPLNDALACLKAMESESMRCALLGYGLLGDPQQMPTLLSAMTVPDLARLAGYAFSTITGIPLDEGDLEGEALPSTDSGPNDDPEDERVAMDSDDSLFWPDAEKITQWWQANQQNYSENRYILGQPVSSANLKQALANGNNFLRHSSAIELALSCQQTTFINTRAVQLLTHKRI